MARRAADRLGPGAELAQRRASRNRGKQMHAFIRTYSTAFHRISARMAPAVVLPERVRRFATTRSPRFLGLLFCLLSALLVDSDFGADLVMPPSTPLLPRCCPSPPTSFPHH